MTFFAESVNKNSLSQLNNIKGNRASRRKLKSLLRRLSDESIEAIDNLKQSLLEIGLILTFTANPAISNAGPQGGNVVEGDATINVDDPVHTIINQSSNSAVINWDSFNIGVGEHTEFRQPSSSSITLNRVISNAPSEIYGRMSANGQVMLINQNGILFGAGSQVDVNSLVSSTADISDSNFMAGKYNFDISGKVDAEIRNEGLITAQEGGFVSLVAPKVSNSGTIKAHLGKITMAATDKWVLDAGGMVKMVVEDDVAAELLQEGHIEADGGTIVLQASAMQEVLSTVVNMSGVTQARTAGLKQGKIVLYGGDGNGNFGGTIEVAGKLDVSGDNVGESGGAVHIVGQQVGLFDQAKIDASADAGGGEILIGGDYKGGEYRGTLDINDQGRGGTSAVNGSAIALEIADFYDSVGGLSTSAAVYIGSDTMIDASSDNLGDAGRVIVWSDGSTKFYGSIEATGGVNGGDGGFVETSGSVLDVRGSADASASDGEAGTWLLDPFDITINTTDNNTSNDSGTPNKFTASGTGATINAATIVTALEGGNNVLVVTTGTGGESGDITVSSDIAASSLTSAVSFTLEAERDIIINGNVDITAAGSSYAMDIILNSDTDASGGGHIRMLGGSTLVSNGGDITLGGGADPTTTAAIGSSGSNDVGVWMDNADINAGDGNISIRGEGYGGDSNNDNIGVEIFNGSTVKTTYTGTSTSKGNITIIGDGGAGGGSNHGVAVYDGSTLITVVDGDISITGNGGDGSGGDNHGIDMRYGGSDITSTGTGANAGKITLIGVGGAGTSNNQGISLEDAAQITSVDGDISLTGTGGGNGTNTNSRGLFIVDGSDIISTGTGANAANITLTGTGGNGTNDNAGIHFATTGTTITAVDGDITMDGTGKGSGTGGDGILFTGGIVVSSTGDTVFSLTGTADDDASAYGISFEDWGSNNANELGGGSATGDIVLVTDIINISTGEFDAETAGTYVLKTESAGVNINLSNTTTTGFHLTSTEVGYFDQTTNDGWELHAHGNILIDDDIDLTSQASESGGFALYADTDTTGSSTITIGDGSGTTTIGNATHTGNITLQADDLIMNAAKLDTDGTYILKTRTADTDINISNSTTSDYHVSSTEKGYFDETDNTGWNIVAHGTIRLQSSIDLTTQGGGDGIILNSDSDGTSSGRVFLGDGSTASTLTSNGGNITIGGGADPTTTAATADDGFNWAGVYINEAELLAGDGNISIRGQGYDAGGSNTMGIKMENPITIKTTYTGTSTSNGNITIVGDGGKDGSGNYGVDISGSSILITVVDGDIKITGNGDGNSGNQDSNRGVTIDAGADVTSTGTGANAGTVTIVGNGGDTGDDNNHGVYIDGSGTKITSVDGDISITGTGGDSSDNNVGIIIDSAVVSSTGTGANAATITLIGTGDGNGNNNIGFRINDSASITSAKGNITITGTGDGSGSGGHGFYMYDNASITSTGAAAISITGVESPTGSSVVGIKIEDTGTNDANVIGGSSAAGDITLITDTLEIEASELSADTTGSYIIKTKSAGVNINISDTTTTGLHISTAELATFDQTSNDGWELYAHNNILIDDDLDLTSAATQSGGFGLYADTDGGGSGTITIGDGSGTTTIGNATHTGDITLQADDLIMNAASLNTDGSFILKTRTAAIDINLSNTTTSGYHVSSTEMAYFDQTDNKGWNLVAHDDILIDDGIDLTTQSGGIGIVINSNSDASGTGGITIGDNGGDFSVLTSNGGAITLGGGADPTTVNAIGNTSGARGVVLNEAKLLSGDGNIIVRGTGGTNGTSDWVFGVFMQNESVIQTTYTGTSTAKGNINIYGTGGANDNSNHGISLENANTLITTVDGDITLTGVGGLANDSNYGVNLQTGADVTTTGTGANAGDINLVGTSAASSGKENYAINITGSGTTVVTADGNIDFTGNASAAVSQWSNHGIRIVDQSVIKTTYDGALTTQGKITLTGTGGRQAHGIAIEDANTTITVVDGDITFNGDGGSTGDYGAGLSFSGGDITSTGTGTDAGKITIVADANNGNAEGANFAGGSLETAAGIVSITGTGSGERQGVLVSGSSVLKSTYTGTSTTFGDITIVGNGSSNGNDARAAVWISGSGTLITAVDSDIDITGNATNNDGIIVENGADITSTGTGANAGYIKLDGDTGTSDSNNHGIEIKNLGTTITAVAGNITIIGDSKGTGNDSYAITVEDQAVIQTTYNGTSTSMGNITLTGTAQASGSQNWAVEIKDSGTLITVNDGDIDITGTGSDNATDRNYGIYVHTSADITSTGTGADAGNIKLTGTGGNPGGGGDNQNYGIFLTGSGSKIAAVDGNITLDGTGKGGGSDGHGIYITNNMEISSTGDTVFSLTGTADDDSSARGIKIEDTGTNAANIIGTGTSGTATGDIILITDILEIEASELTAQTTGSYIIKAENNSTTIGIGGGTGDLNLTDDELNSFQDGATSIQIGSTTHTGLIDFDAYSWNDALEIYSNTGEINIDGIQTMSANNLSIYGGGTIDINAGLTGTGTLTFAGISNGTTLGVGTGAAGTATIDDTGLGNITDGWSNIVFGSTTNTATIDLSNNTYADNVIVKSNTGEINVTDTIAMGANNITFQSGGVIDIDAGVGGSGTITFVGLTDATSLGVGSGAAGTATIDDTGLGNITNGWTDIIFGSATNTATIDLSNNTYADNVTVKSNSGLIDITDALALGANDLTFSTNGDVDVGAALGGTGTLTFQQGSDNSTTIGLGGAAGTLGLSDAELDFITDGWSSIVIGSNSLTGVIEVDAYANWTDNLTLQSNTGVISINDNQTSDSNITITSNATSELDSAATVTITGATVTLDTLDANSKNLVVNADSLVIDAISEVADVTFTTDAINVGGALSGQGAGDNLVIDGKTNATTIGVGTGATGTINLTDAEVTNLGSGWDNVQFGNASTTGNMEIKAVTWSDDLLLKSNSGTITIAGNQTMGTNDITVTSSGDLALSNNIVNAGAVSITTTSISGGGDIAGSSVVIVTTGDTTIGDVNTGAGTLDITADNLVAGDLTSGVTTISSAGDLTIATLTPSSGTVTFDSDDTGGATATIATIVGAPTITGGSSVGNKLNITGDITAGASTLDFTAETITFGGDVGAAQVDLTGKNVTISTGKTVTAPILNFNTTGTIQGDIDSTTVDISGTKATLTGIVDSGIDQAAANKITKSTTPSADSFYTFNGFIIGASVSASSSSSSSSSSASSAADSVINVSSAARNQVGSSVFRAFRKWFSKVNLFGKIVKIKYKYSNRPDTDIRSVLLDYIIVNIGNEIKCEGIDCETDIIHQKLNSQ